jgi:hypothetical protein
MSLLLLMLRGPDGCKLLSGEDLECVKRINWYIDIETVNLENFKIHYC